MSTLVLRKEMEKESQGAFVEPLLAKQEAVSEDSLQTNGGMDLQVIQPRSKSTMDIAASDELICINLTGKKFFVMLKNFANLPNSRLGHMVRSNEQADIEKFCDKFIAGPVPEYFFDRSGKGFNDILDVYRLGRLHINTAGMCAIKLKAQLDYWSIDELLLDPCCALKFYPEMEVCEKEITGQNNSEQKYLERIQEEDFGDTQIGRIRKMLWNLTEYPETSLAARICAFTSISVVIISTITFVLSTLPELTDNIDIMLFDNSTEDGDIGDHQIIERWDEGILMLKIVDELTMWFFTIGRSREMWFFTI
ncbi:potassium voltage-gated channel protein Shab, partial [Eurytemora carolleeae]|uniref:potassium voltage-gated channel protein Shab n=1 Tax=Eurytemora carolleeae TaxID=1294199 RepID=UPI000C786E9C